MELTRQFSWRGRTVAWETFGSGTPVVLCHGTPWSAWLWEPFATALAEEYQVFLWDMPGYGSSSKDPEHDVDLGVQGELFAELLEHWGLERPHVIAHDYGGAVSLRAHLVHGKEFASLALVDVVALRPWGSAFFRLVAENAEVFEQLPGNIHKAAVESYIATASHRGLTATQLDALTGPWCGDEGKPAFYRQIEEADECYTNEIQDRYGEIAIPVTVIWGAQDSWIPVDRAHRLAECIPGARATIIEGAGHLIQLDAPVELAIALHRWLGSVTG
ncbi:alpha/beta fold hydrolase [Sciscionella sediminilitoris]|uniref:alpha/beta fold hydrolase n=1 Tax=Sciscionella sediminilitoris TaxID=1445613 RepID=UPI0004DECFAD|nr:alpha/beta hydrolase [Sciscionella sp. SE31]